MYYGKFFKEEKKYDLKTMLNEGASKSFESSSE